MSDSAPPPSVPRPPAMTPPSMERSVPEPLDVVHELRELRVAMAALTTTVARLITTRTDDRLTLGVMEKRMGVLETLMQAQQATMQSLQELLQRLSVERGA